jgi:hypothetical protein
MKKLTVFALTIVLTIFAGLLLMRDNIHAEGLERLALQIGDLPEGTVQFPEELLDKDDISHPLNSLTVAQSEFALEKATVHKYKDAYSFRALTPNGVFIAHYLYEYPDGKSAKQTADLLVGDLDRAGTIEDVFENGIALRGQTFTLIGDEGDSIFWFVGVEDQILHLILANGMEKSSVEEEFRLVVKNLMQE